MKMISEIRDDFTDILEMTFYSVGVASTAAFLAVAYQQMGLLAVLGILALLFLLGYSGHRTVKSIEELAAEDRDEAGDSE